MSLKTTDISDKYGAAVQLADALFSDYGGNKQFEGRITTLKLFEDNVLIHEAVQEPGEGRVLVIDGGGSIRTALLGDHLAGRAAENHWAGIVVYGAIRDSREVGQLAIGVKALGAHPRRPGKKRTGERDTVIAFAGVTFKPGAYLYADEDGILVAAEPVSLD